MKKLIFNGMLMSLVLSFTMGGKPYEVAVFEAVIYFMVIKTFIL